MEAQVKKIKYGIVDATKAEVRYEEHADFHDAVRAAGLDPKATDHGLLMPRLSYVVYEYGFFEPAEKMRFWRFGNRLVAGNAVLYSIDERGETIDLKGLPTHAIQFYGSVAEIEHDIRMQRVARPQHSINDVVSWQWPQPKPEYMKR